MIEQIRIPPLPREISSSRRIGGIRGDEQQKNKQKQAKLKRDQKPGAVVETEIAKGPLSITDDEQPLKGSKIDEVV